MSQSSSNVVALNAADGKPVKLPFNIEAEQALLGAILINNDAFWRVADFLVPEHFYEDAHREIYTTLGKIIRAGKVATPVTAKTFLPEALIENGTTMPQYLARLAGDATTVINAEDYGRIVFEMSQRRALFTLSQEMGSAALSAELDMPAAAQVEYAERALYDIGEKGGDGGGFRTFATALTQAVEMAAAAYQRDGSLSGLATGLDDLDRLMGGLQRSDLVIIAGRPGMGKTALATGIAFHAARRYQFHLGPDGRPLTDDGARVGFFSLEMSAEQLATRILAGEAKIPSSEIRRGNIHASQWDRFVTASQAIASAPLMIDDSGGLNVGQLATRARRLKRQKGLELIVVDYLQLLGGNDRRENRVQELTQITTALKALAKELDVPILALSQLSRAVEQRDDKQPQLSDLRDSGSIEQDADVVLFVYREEYYLKNKEPPEDSSEHLAWQQAMERVHGRAEVIIGKQRHGPTGTVPVAFEAGFTRFSNLARSEYLPDRTGGGGGL